MLNKVKNTIEKYNLINENDKILVAVSGGPDSISLLNVLYELKYNICVAHVNHGLRENAKLDEEYVLNYCKEKNIPCFIKRVNLKEMLNGMTTEEAGRKVRYDFFIEILEKENCSKIATAHNNNDSAETVLMNIIRGSGISGLKGIEAKRNNLIRPLIECSRDKIEEYCKKNNVRIGIITVGAGSAQDVCNSMIKSGITAIWNFAPCNLEVPDGILLKQERLALSLAYLNNKLGN